MKQSFGKKNYKKSRALKKKIRKIEFISAFLTAIILVSTAILATSDNLVFSQKTEEKEIIITEKSNTKNIESINNEKSAQTNPLDLPTNSIETTPTNNADTAYQLNGVRYNVFVDSNNTITSTVPQNVQYFNGQKFTQINELPSWARVEGGYMSPFYINDAGDTATIFRGMGIDIQEATLEFVYKN